MKDVMYCPYCSSDRIRTRDKRKFRCDICGKRFDVQFEGVDR